MVTTIRFKCKRPDGPNGERVFRAKSLMERALPVLRATDKDTVHTSTAYSLESRRSKEFARARHFEKGAHQREACSLRKISVPTISLPLRCTRKWRQDGRYRKFLKKRDFMMNMGGTSAILRLPKKLAGRSSNAAPEEYTS